MMDYTIDKNDVLTYLGYSNQPLDDKLNTLLDDTIALSYEYIKPLSIYGIFDITANEERISFQDLFDVASADLYNLLKYSKKAVLAAFTLGSDIEQNIKLFSYTEINKAVILDCCAAAAIESYADNVLAKLAEEVKKDNLNLTNRFSCGYGDFSLSHQADIIAALSARKRIGLYADDNNMLYPKKSMTAVIGITADNINHKYYAGCENCAAKNNCRYRKAGRTCAS
jgi:hypothetical protein